jgi:hypothetical protein
MLAPVTAHFLPMMERGGTSRYPSLALGDLSRGSLGLLLPCLQVLRGLFQVSLGLLLSTEDG